jgi:micrococcal nuclease
MRHTVSSLLLLSLFCFSFCSALSACVNAKTTTNKATSSTLVEESSPSFKRHPCTGLMVYDGDTFACDMNGDRRIQRPKEQVRLLGMDTPEMHYSKKNKQKVDQPYAVVSKQFLEKAVLYQTVWLEDDLEHTDRYGRHLAYVFTSPKGGISLNQQLIEKGYAKLLFLGANRRYEVNFMDSAITARQKGLALYK